MGLYIWAMFGIGITGSGTVPTTCPLEEQVLVQNKGGCLANCEPMTPGIWKTRDRHLLFLNGWVRQPSPSLGTCYPQRPSSREDNKESRAKLPPATYPQSQLLPCSLLSKQETEARHEPRGVLKQQGSRTTAGTRAKHLKDSESGPGIVQRHRVQCSSALIQMETEPAHW